MSNQVLTPQEMRARLVASYIDSYNKLQIAMHRDAVERQVLADLEMVDSAKRAGDLSSGQRKAPSKTRGKDALHAAVAETGGGARLVDGKGKTVRSRMFDGPGGDARWRACKARVFRILQGAQGSTLGRALQDAGGSALRPLAQEVGEQYALYMVRNPFPHPCGVGCNVNGNPYCSIADSEADGKFRRKLEDICDRSTGVLGSWYVK